MSSEARRRVAKNIRLSDVYARKVNAALGEDADPKYADYSAGYSIEPKVKAAKIGYWSEGPDHFISIHFETECNIKDVATENPADGNDAASAVLEVTVSAELVAEYLVDATDIASRDEWLEDFARINASLHIWPYWRELVQDMCSRLGVHRIVLPTYPYDENAEQ